jgi:hypothetical protein
MTLGPGSKDPESSPGQRLFVTLAIGAFCRQGEFNLTVTLLVEKKEIITVLPRSQYFDFSQDIADSTST